MSHHVDHTVDSLGHPLVVLFTYLLNIMLNLIPTGGLPALAHGILITIQIIAGCMAAVASGYAIRHYRLQAEIMKKTKE